MAEQAYVEPTLREQMNAIDWYHCIDLGPELGITPGRCPDDSVRLKYMNIPQDLHGARVLDIGAWDGYFSFECERRGAAVLATDIWGDYRMGKEVLFNGGEGIQFAASVLKSKIEMVDASISDMPAAIWDRFDPSAAFDLILCAGVIYHLQDPLQALRNLHPLLREDGLLILETHLDLLSLERPAMALYPSNECAEDPTNYCGPNKAAVETLLKWAGYSRVAFQGGINLSAWPELSTVNYARGAWHARK